MEQYYIIPKNTIDDIENSIQRKRGSDAPIEPSEMPLAIDTIPSSVDGTDVPVGGIYLTKPDGNGNPTEAYIIGYAPVVNYTWGDMLGYNYFPYLKKIEFINTDNIIHIRESAFQNCSSLTTINLPNSLTSIWNNTFLGCSSLTTINLPNSLTSIEPRAFFGCSSLTTINLPNSLTSINSYAFQNCSSLTTINLPNSLTSIWDNTFQGCSSLENVTIGTGFNCNNLNLSASTHYSVETMVSWFNALADRTGQTPYTLTIGTTNLNKLTAEQKAIANANSNDEKTVTDVAESML